VLSNFKQTYTDLHFKENKPRILMTALVAKSNANHGGQPPNFLFN